MVLIGVFDLDDAQSSDNPASNDGLPAMDAERCGGPTGLVPEMVLGQLQNHRIADRLDGLLRDVEGVGAGEATEPAGPNQHVRRLFKSGEDELVGVTDINIIRRNHVTTIEADVLIRVLDFVVVSINISLFVSRNTMLHIYPLR